MTNRATGELLLFFMSLINVLMVVININMTATTHFKLNEVQNQLSHSADYQPVVWYTDDSLQGDTMWQVLEKYKTFGAAEEAAMVRVNELTQDTLCQAGLRIITDCPDCENTLLDIDEQPMENSVPQSGTNL